MAESSRANTSNLLAQAQDDPSVLDQIEIRSGGLDLIDDGSSRLRERRVSDTHPPHCPCQYCRQVCCVACHALGTPLANKVWVGLSAFGRHVHARHPQSAQFKRAASLLTHSRRQLRELRLAEEVKRARDTGLRTIPLANLSPEDQAQIGRYIEAAYNDPRNTLLLGSIELAEDSPQENVRTRKEFERRILTLTREIERGVRLGIFTCTEHVTRYDPRVALQILKLSFALGRSWSFTTHLLLMYGLDAFARNLAAEGTTPPRLIARMPSPDQLQRHTEKNLVPRALGKRPRRHYKLAATRANRKERGK